MAVIQMSDRELTRLRVSINLAVGRLTVNAAAAPMRTGRRRVYLVKQRANLSRFRG